MIHFYLLLTILFYLGSLAIGQQPNFDNLIPQNSLDGIFNANAQSGDVLASDNKPNRDESAAKNCQLQQEKNQVEATKFEIKAILTKCSKPKPCDCESTFQCTSNDTQNVNLKTKDFRTKCEEQADDKFLKNCDKKISLTLKIKNKGLTNCNPQYIILDHVFDPATDKKQKLLNPYVLKITQRPVYQTYDLLFENIVNSGPSERVVNKNNDESFSGCSTDPTNPTCGSVQEVPYSAGFCCSCQSPTNSASDPGTNINGIINTIDPKDISNLDLPNLNIPSINGDTGLREANMPYLPEYNKIDYGHDGLTDKSGKIKENDLPINGQNMIPDNFGSAPRIGRQSLVKEINRQHLKKRIHRRGGQDCDDKYTPSYADSGTYHDSAHCMEFSEVWYSIYKIANANVDHSLKIQIFEKIGIRENDIYWKEVTSPGTISVGTANQRYAYDDGTLLAYYTVNKEIESEFALDCKSHKILIPEISGRQDGQFSEINGGPSEYLVVKESDVDLSGKTCNKAGVGYEAFAQQPKRCESDRNSCLQNQPKQMWEHDHELEANGKKGCYFLKNYGILPDNPVRMKPCNGSSKKTQNKLLFMYYLPCLTSSVNINFIADLNAILRPDTLAAITEVYTETLNPKRVTITAKILNSGLVTSIFYVGIGACPMEMPASFGSITSQPVLIAPQHQHMFTLEIYCELTIKNFYCSLEVFNMKHQLVAVRRIRFERIDRCICVWYCQCVCFSSDYALKCSPLEIEQYHVAGFQGGMPISTQVVNYSEFDDTLSVFLHIILYFCITLWYMGVMKAMLGCFILPIGLWGLDKILELPKKLNRYYEEELKDQEVLYDDEGWPIHPETGKKVNNVAPPTQFAINMVFFFIFPFALLWDQGKKLLGPKYPVDEMFDDLDICKCRASQISLLKDKSLQKKKGVDLKQFGQSEEGIHKGHSSCHTSKKTDGKQDISGKKSKGSLSVQSRGHSITQTDSKTGGKQNTEKTTS